MTSPAQTRGALYNRYRPRTFAEVVGQTDVTDALQQMLRSGRLHHAYLFSGPRGCGKTSSARILAASLNCVNGPTPEPCGVCEQCTSIRTGTSMDVIEIDAASHGGVDDTRALRDQVEITPASSRYRVFIIDEAHMITRAGFNALLKVVEEPPEHAVFAFATTEPEQVLQTIRSRTFHYRFGLVAPAVLNQHLANVCAQEQVLVEPAVLPLVVRVGEGSVRDSMSVLDQLIAGVGAEGVTYEVAARRLGLTPTVLLDTAVDALAVRDGAALFDVVETVVGTGADARRFSLDLLERFRDLILLNAVPDAQDRGLLEQVPADLLARMSAQATRLGAAELSRAADIVHAGLTEMRGTTTPRLVLELVCARLLLPSLSHDQVSLLTRIEQLERRAPAAVATPTPLQVTAPPPRPRVAPAAEPAHEAVDAHIEAAATEPGLPPAAVAGLPAAAPAARPAAPAPTPAGPGGITLDHVVQSWPTILEDVNARKRVTKALLDRPDVVPTALEDGTLTLTFTLAPISRSFLSGVNSEVLADAIAKVLGPTLAIRVAVAGVDAPTSQAATTPVRPAVAPAPVRPGPTRPEPAHAPVQAPVQPPVQLPRAEAPKRPRYVPDDVPPPTEAPSDDYDSYPDPDDAPAVGVAHAPLSEDDTVALLGRTMGAKLIG